MGLELQRDANGTVMVKNKLHGEIAHLLLRDEAGRYFVAEQIADEDSAALGPSTSLSFADCTEEWVAGGTPIRLFLLALMLAGCFKTAVTTGGGPTLILISAIPR